MANSHSAAAAWQTLLDIAERRQDARSLLALARLRHNLAEIERLARDARHGQYRYEEEQ